MYKNVSGQKVSVYAIDGATLGPKVGDAANITVYVSKDDGAVTALADTSATEADATNAKGDYLFDLTQAETNAHKLRFTGRSSTANVVIVPQTIYTAPPNFSGTAVDASGRLRLAPDGLDDVNVYTDGGSGHSVNARQALAGVFVLRGPTAGFAASGGFTAAVAAPGVAATGTPAWSFTVNASGDVTAATFTPPA